MYDAQYGELILLAYDWKSYKWAALTFVKVNILSLIIPNQETK